MNPGLLRAAGVLIAVAIPTCLHVYLRWQAARDQWDLDDEIRRAYWRDAAASLGAPMRPSNVLDDIELHRRAMDALDPNRRRST